MHGKDMATQSKKTSLWFIGKAGAGHSGRGCDSSGDKSFGSLLQGSSELQDVIGASFHALAEGSAAKVDAELQRIITVDRLLAQQAEDDLKVHAKLLGNQPQGKNSSAAQFNWPSHRGNRTSYRCP